VPVHNADMQAHRVLARKWRPGSFADVVGQGHVLQALRHALQSGRLHHAYLFTGTRGVGKTTLARVLARALNCETGVTPDPCGRCSACQAIEAGSFVDLIELDAASNTQVDRMRDLLENALYAPSVGRFKVYVIDEVHQLSGSAFNAMLKTLEEPPEHVKFVLATTDPQKIPVTVLSRCMQFGLKPIAETVIVERLSHILAQERVAAEPEALALLARAARGSLRDALSLLDQAIAFGGGQVQTAAVADMLGVADGEAITALLDALSRGDAQAALAAADAVVDRGVSLDAALQELARQTKQVALLRTLPDADAPVALQQIAGRFSATDLQVLYQVATHARAELDWAPDAESGFVMAVLRMLALAAPQDTVNAPAVAGLAPADAHTVSIVRGLGANADPINARPAAPIAAIAGDAVPSLATTAIPALATATSDMSATSANTTGVAFDGDWPALVTRLRLVGRSKMLGDRCVLQAVDGRVLRLALPGQYASMREAGVERQLEQAVQTLLGNDWSVRVEVQDVAADATPIARRESDRAIRQADAEQAIRDDPFVRGLIDQMGGRIDETSVRPLQTDARDV